MKRENINYLLVGTFVLLIMASFFVFLYQITGRTGPADNYFVSYSNVTGIKYGTPVLFEGFQVGQVETIEPARTQGQMRYRLTLSIQEDWPIPEESVAKIIASGLLAAVTIDIQAGESEILLKPESEIKGREAANIFAAVNDVAADIRDLSRNSIKPLLSNFNKQVDAIAFEFTDLTRNVVKPMLENISSQIDETNPIRNVDKLIKNLNQTSEEIQKVFNRQNQDNLNKILSNLNQASYNMNELLNELDGTRESMDLLLSNIDNVTGDINHMLESSDDKLDASLTDLQKTLSVISTHINTISHHLEGSSRNIHEFTRQIKENPSMLIRSSAQEGKSKQ